MTGGLQIIGMELVNDSELLIKSIRNNGRIPWDTTHKNIVAAMKKIQINYDIITQLLHNVQKQNLGQYFNNGLSHVYLFYTLVESVTNYILSAHNVEIGLPEHITNFLKDVRRCSSQYAYYHISNPDIYFSLNNKMKDNVIFLLSMQLLIDITFIPGITLRDDTNNKINKSKLFSQINKMPLFTEIMFLTDDVREKIKHDVNTWLNKIMNSDKPLIIFSASDFILLGKELFQFQA